MVADSELLGTLTKHELMALADTYDVDGRRGMNKAELVEELSHVGVQLDDLTKRELFALGEVQGIDVRTSMSKQELVDAISTING